MKDDSVKVKKLKSYASDYIETNPDFAKKIYTDILSISQKIKNKSCESKCLLAFAVLYRVKGQHDLARSYDWKALDAAFAVNNNEDIGRVYNNIGNTFYFQNEFDSAVTYYLKSLNYLEKTKNYYPISMVYGNLAMIFNNQHQYSKALQLAKKSLLFANMVKPDMNTLGTAHNNCGDAFGGLNQLDSQQYHYKRALDFFNKDNDLTNLTVLYRNMADVEIKRNNSKLAQAFADSSLKYAKIVGNNYEIGSTFIRNCDVTLKYNNLKNAKYFINEAEVYIKSDKNWMLHREWNLQMSKLKRKQNKYEEAFLYFDTYLQYRDSTENAETKNRTTLLEEKYQSDKKQSEIIRLENEKQIQQLIIRQKNVWLYILIGTILSLSIIAFLFNKNTKRKQQIVEQQLLQLQQEKELEATKTVLKVQEEERGRVAKDLHDGLGGMLSGIKLNLSAMKGNVILQQQDAGLFAKSIEQLDNAISEMRRVAHNMMPESLLKFGLTQAIQDYCESINESKIVKLTFKDFGLNERLESSVEIVLYRIIQELVNNSIKHAQAKNTVIQLVKNSANITLTVEDDGNGFDINKFDKLKGFGLTNIQSRVDYLKGNLTVDSELNKGTSVFIEIPN
ncbi:MAG: tetratricopeptide repeat protein [Sphingobacteriales bacterium]|nr:tetratricopeptide repeat protein [Sphingobacteriales bacterium]